MVGEQGRGDNWDMARCGSGTKRTGDASKAAGRAVRTAIQPVAIASLAEINFRLDNGVQVSSSHGDDDGPSSALRELRAWHNTPTTAIEG